MPIGKATDIPAIIIAAIKRMLATLKMIPPITALAIGTK